MVSISTQILRIAPFLLANFNEPLTEFLVFTTIQRDLTVLLITVDPIDTTIHIVFSEPEDFDIVETLRRRIAALRRTWRIKVVAVPEEDAEPVMIGEIGVNPEALEEHDDPEMVLRTPVSPEIIEEIIRKAEKVLQISIL